VDRFQDFFFNTTSTGFGNLILTIPHAVVALHWAIGWPPCDIHFVIANPDFS
jgi:hypothetical protein